MTNRETKIYKAEWDKMDDNQKYEFTGGLMIIDFMNDLQDDEYYQSIPFSQIIKIKSGNTIIGVLVADETCAYYEHTQNMKYQNPGDPEIIFKTVKEIAK